MEKAKETTKYDALIDLQGKIGRALQTIGFCEDKIKTGRYYLGDVTADKLAAEKVLVELKELYDKVLKT